MEEVLNQNVDGGSAGGMREERVGLNKAPFLFSPSLRSHHHLTLTTTTAPLSKMFSCNTCNATFMARADLYLHYRDQHNHKLFTCQYCDKLFTRSSSLKTHIRVHTGERPYRCSECGKTFTQLSNVLQHNRDVHIKDKRFKCTMCDKAFSRLETLQCHIRVHTGERIFSCERCGKAFSQRANLKVHLRIHRGEKTRPKRAEPQRPCPTPCPTISAIYGGDSFHNLEKLTLLQTMLRASGGREVTSTKIAKPSAIHPLIPALSAHRGGQLQNSPVNTALAALTSKMLFDGALNIELIRRLLALITPIPSSSSRSRNYCNTI